MEFSFSDYVGKFNFEKLRGFFDFLLKGKKETMFKDPDLAFREVSFA